ncbi:uncharacterized protein LOC124121930 [Haliotis rufescens]|uniref:uncharacterized protein LOC124121930 n=1 Tax=Haliotis rufescens TaxID=6454 RepID=UPI001EAF9916|nr:uncharacterized protein LOC124121930 [Haliotis rufescens]
MAAKSSFENVVILSGPPCSGKSHYCKKMYKHQKDLCRVCPAELYKENPDFGLRDICLHICGLLKKGKRVILDDVSDQHTTRKAYFTAIKKKFPACKVKVVQIRPEYGELQCQWAAQFAMADTPDTDSGETLNNKQAEIQKWFLSDHAMSDSKEGTEDLTVVQETLPLTAVTNYKLEVPALFFQWEGLNTHTRNVHLTAQLCQGWSTAYRCGRVFIVCDGKNVSKGLINQQEENFSVRTFVKAVAQQVNIPIYVLQLTELTQAGSFCVPQEPGILAFLQKRHHLHLHCRATQYIYASAAHKAMAERAGVRHIKISQVLHHPKLLVSAHSSSTPRIPELLQHLTVEAGDEELPAEIPLYSHMDDLDDGCIKMELPGGRREMLFSKNIQVVHNYQNDYITSATLVGQVGSLIHNERGSKSVPSEPPPSPTSMSDVPTLSSDSSTGSTAAPVRDLPTWMLGKSKKSPAPSLSKSDSASSTEGRSRFRSTVYVMTELELVEAARQVLKQGGREDLLQVLDKRAEEETGKATGVPTPNKEQTHKSKVVVDGEFEDMLAVPTLSTDYASPRKRQIPAHELSPDESTNLPSPAKRRTVSPEQRRKPGLVEGEDRGSDENVDEKGRSRVQGEGETEESHLRSRRCVSDVLNSIFD